MKNLIKDGKRMTYTNGTGSDISAGDVVVVGSQIGIAAVDIDDGDSGELALEGVFEVTKTAGTAFTQGDAVQYDISASAFVPSSATAATGDITGCCIAHEAAASAAVVANVAINVGVGTITA